jgi:hypothetical protein
MSTCKFGNYWLCCSHLHIVSILNKQRKPHNILMRVCLLIFGLLSLVLFWQLTRELMGRVMKGGVLRNTGSCLQAHYSSLGLHAGYTLWRVYFLWFIYIFRFDSSLCDKISTWNSSLNRFFFSVYKGVVIIYGVVGGGWFLRHKLKFSITLSWAIVEIHNPSRTRSKKFQPSSRKLF